MRLCLSLKHWPKEPLQTDGVKECRESCSTSAESVEISIDKAKQFMKDYRKPQ